MSYTPTVYVDGQAPDLSAANLNHNENGLQAAAAVADAALPTPAGTNGQFLKRVGGVWVPTSFAISDIPDPTTGKVVGSSGGVATAVFPPGYEFGYDQITGNVTVSSSTEASGTTVISCAAHVFDGAPVVAEFFSPSIVTPGANAYCIVSLFEGATQIGRLCIAEGGTVLSSAVVGKLRLTPSAVSHTYTVTAFFVTTTGPIIGAGAGGTGTSVPAYIRFTKA